MNAIVLKCKPGSRFHFGKFAPDADTALNDSDAFMHSDTLFSALVNIYQELLGDAQPLVDAFRNGKIAISSLFYCFQQEEKYTWLLPKPVCFDLFDGGSRRKIFKEVQWLSKSVWETLLNPASLIADENIILAAKNKIALHTTDIQFPENLTEKDFNKISCGIQDTLPKVLVRETEEEKTVYQLTVNEIADNRDWVNNLQVHFYFLLHCSETADAAVVNNLNQVVAMLHWFGIGAERSTIGQVEKTDIVENWSLSLPGEHAEYAATVSLLNPGAGENDHLHYYRSILRGGRRLGFNYTRDAENRYLKTVRMALEGAIVQKNIQGCLQDISPLNDEKFLRYGKAFCLPIPQTWIPEPI